MNTKDILTTLRGLVMDDDFGKPHLVGMCEMLNRLEENLFAEDGMIALVRQVREPDGTKSHDVIILPALEAGEYESDEIAMNNDPHFERMKPSEACELSNIGHWWRWEKE